MIAVRFTDLQTHTADEQTEYDGDLVLDGPNVTCDSCALDVTHYFEDPESGVSNCLACIGDLVNKGYAKMEEKD